MVSAINPAVARYIVRVRRSAGLSQSDLARAIGSTQAFVSLVERGERAFSQRRADRMAAFLGLPRFCHACARPMEDAGQKTDLTG